MKLQIAVTKALLLAVGFALCGAPELLHAWQQPAQQPQSEPAPVINGTTVNPSQGPLMPVPAGNAADAFSAEPARVDAGAFNTVVAAPELSLRRLPPNPWEPRLPRVSPPTAAELRVRLERLLPAPSSTRCARCF